MTNPGGGTVTNPGGGTAINPTGDGTPNPAVTGTTPTGMAGMAGPDVDPIDTTTPDPTDTSTTDPTDTTPLPDREDLGEGTGQDVITIGDSYMNFLFGQGTEFSLEAISGRDYRNYAVPGTLMLNGQIPGQWDIAVAANADIKTVVMTGGGNDVIQVPSVLSACQTFDDACKAEIDTISAAVEELMTKMADAGVEDIIYLGYYYPTLWDLSATTDYSRTETAKTCLSDGSGPAGVRCHHIDPIELESTPIPLGIDGIHPTKAGYDRLAELVWARMQAEGVRR